MKIIELINNMRDELNRAESVLSWLYIEHPEIYSAIQDSELGDTLTQDIRNDLERTQDLFEREDRKSIVITKGNYDEEFVKICNQYGCSYSSNSEFVTELPKEYKKAINHLGDEVWQKVGCPTSCPCLIVISSVAYQFANGFMVFSKPEFK